MKTKLNIVFAFVAILGGLLPAGGEASYVLDLKGQWTSRPISPLSDAMALEGWQPYWIGPFSVRVKNGTVLDFGAQPKDMGAKTLGELRSAIIREEQVRKAEYQKRNRAK